MKEGELTPSVGLRLMKGVPPGVAGPLSEPSFILLSIGLDDSEIPEKYNRRGGRVPGGPP